MGNVIKYTTTPVNNSIKKGNFALGINDIDYGPTNITGFYSTTIPSTSGYTVYNENGGTLSYESVSGTTPLINYLSNKRGVLMTTAGESLSWAAGQSNIFVTNREYENIVTSGMVLNLDAGFVSSYPTSATTWYDLSYSGNNGTLTNGPTFSSLSGGSIVFDGTNDYVSIPSHATSSGLTLSFWAYMPNTFSDLRTLIGDGSQSNTVGYIWIYRNSTNGLQWQFATNTTRNLINDTTIFAGSLNTWANYVFVADYTNYPTGSLTTYKNGVLSTTTTFPNIQIPLSRTRFIGSYDNSGTYPLSGNISSYVEHNRALTQAEITQNFNALRGRYGI
jgi:hypothetical protein